MELRPATGLGERGHHIASVACTCPYSFEGWCKHAAALVLSAIEMPSSVDERPSFDTTLAAQGTTALRRALLDLADAHPELMDEIEARVEGREPPEPLGYEEDDRY